MDERQKIDLVKRTWFAVVAQDLDQALPHIADDLEWTLYAKLPGATPMGRGKAAVRDVARQMRQSLRSGVEIVMRREHCAGETVILEYSVRAAAFNGRPYDNNCCLLFDLRGDQICAIREYLDSLTTYNTFFAGTS